MRPEQRKHIHQADVMLTAIVVSNYEMKITGKKRDIIEVISYLRLSIRHIFLGALSTNQSFFLLHITLLGPLQVSGSIL